MTSVIRHDGLLHVEWDEAGESRWTDAADTLVTLLSRPPAEALAAAGLFMAAFPGCVLAAVPFSDQSGWVVACRTGEAVMARPDRADPDPGWRPAVLAFLHTRLMSGGQVGEETTLRVDTPSGTVTVTLGPLGDV